ncbi:DUF2382 domain-containing protein [Anditalea andensis]|uniref:DUF2382 domain-containing protein n=1 Tax=Anditalea andensis TaxID=1048983 RepID=A0A074KVW9_9BACT|nr:PRC and DUF2382 domain-containing protein [Anditalea andensis]KEO71758.1 hypothetical protein EL17_21470 [Anditalea andensis]
MASNSNDNNKLVELGGSNYKVADNYPNIINWTVKDDLGRKYGNVNELLFHPASKKVRYMVLDLDGNEFDFTPKKVLIPIGKATLHEKDDDVILPELVPNRVGTLPSYEKHQEINPSTEKEIRQHLTSPSPTSTKEHHDDSFYEHEDFDENRFYKNRQAGTMSASIPILEEKLDIEKKEEETGRTYIYKTIVENDIEEKIYLKEEHVEVNRKPVDRAATDQDLQTFEEGEMEIKETKEIPVVNKEARVVEEIEIKKTTSNDEHTIYDSIRKTKIDIDDHNPNSPTSNENLGDIEDPNRK